MKESLQNFYKSVYNNPMNTKEEFINFYGNLNQNLSALITGISTSMPLLRPAFTVNTRNHTPVERPTTCAVMP